MALRAHALDPAETAFAMRDGLVCHCRRRSGYTIVILEDVDLRHCLIAGTHEPPLSGHLGVYRTVGTLL